MKGLFINYYFLRSYCYAIPVAALALQKLSFVVSDAPFNNSKWASKSLLVVSSSMPCSQALKDNFHVVSDDQNLGVQEAAMSVLAYLSTVSPPTSKFIVPMWTSDFFHNLPKIR